MIGKKRRETDLHYLYASYIEKYTNIDCTHCNTHMETKNNKDA